VANSRVNRQLNRQAIEPRTLSSLRQQQPRIHEFTYGPIVSLAQIISPNYPICSFRYVSVPAPLKLYMLRMRAVFYAAAGVPPGTNMSVKAALYHTRTADPGQGADILGSGLSNDAALEFELISEAKQTYSPNYYDSTAGAPPTSDSVNSSGVFYFDEEPVLLPGNDYYICCLSSGGTGATTAYWSDAVQPSLVITAAHCWYALPESTAFPKRISSNNRGAAGPAIVLNSRHGIYKSGRVI